MKEGERECGGVKVNEDRDVCTMDPLSVSTDVRVLKRMSNQDATDAQKSAQSGECVQRYI